MKKHSLLVLLLLTCASLFAADNNDSQMPDASPSSTGQELTWSKLPIDMKEKIMQYVWPKSALRSNLLQRVPGGSLIVPAEEGDRAGFGCHNRSVLVYDDLTQFNAICNWFEKGCNPTRKRKFFDPLETFLLLTECNNALQQDNKRTLSIKQQVYFNLLPPKVQKVLEDAIRRASRCSIM
ncbi:MAG: hypothetical protein ACD_64C00217G0002 [uncultured bacterium]|nr:MAG: hypothetical protein ACD_64C00217G0002 [uncultured bacterium]